MTRHIGKSTGSNSDILVNFTQHSGKYTGSNSAKRANSTTMYRPTKKRWPLSVQDNSRTENDSDCKQSHRRLEHHHESQQQDQKDHQKKQKICEPMNQENHQRPQEESQHQYHNKNLQQQQSDQLTSMELNKGGQKRSPLLTTNVNVPHSTWRNAPTKPETRAIVYKDGLKYMKTNNMDNPGTPGHDKMDINEPRTLGVDQMKIKIPEL